jgi:hypothetical protein
MKFSKSDSKNEKYLHISPSGDFWFGTTIFAAVSEDECWILLFVYNASIEKELVNESLRLLSLLVI